MWDDAFKFSRSSLFDAKYRSLEQVLIDFNKKKKFDRFSVFNKGIFTTDDVTVPYSDDKEEQTDQEEHPVGDVQVENSNPDSGV